MDNVVHCGALGGLSEFKLFFRQLISRLLLTVYNCLSTLFKMQHFELYIIYKDIYIIFP